MKRNLDKLCLLYYKSGLFFLKKQGNQEILQIDFIEERIATVSIHLSEVICLY